MDYVVYGTGYGATLMLLGYALRTWGPGLRYRNADENAYDRREIRTARASWSRFTGGLGAVIATCGAALALLTFLLMLVNPGDSVGVMVVLGATVAALIGVGVWAWMYFDRFGAWGVVAQPQALASHEPIRYDERAEAAPAVATAEDADTDTFDEDDEYAAVAYERRHVDDEEDEEALEAVDDGELAARYSKFELHHPDKDAAEVASAAASDDDAEVADGATTVVAASSAETSAVSDNDVSADEKTPVANVADNNAETEATADAGDEDPFLHVYVDSVETVDDSDGADDLEVLPEAHDPDVEAAVTAGEATTTGNTTADVTTADQDAATRERRNDDA